MTVLCERLGVTFDELAESFLYDEEAAAEYKIMAKALEESRKRA
jgi:hypothetical protein